MRIKQRPVKVLVLLGAILPLGGIAAAGPTDAEKCEADKLKRAGKYAFCRMKAESKAVKTGDAPDYSKCDTKLSDKFANAELKWGMECPTSGDAGDIQAQVTGDTDDLVTVLSGGTLARFEDTGLTIIDHQTGLEWEKKTGAVGAASVCPGGANCGDPNNVNNLYTWSNSGTTAFNGGAQTLFLDLLNDVAGGGTTCFAGHCDWRLPTSGGCCGTGPVQPAELESIVDCSGGAPCVDPAFGPTWSSLYWSSSTVAGLPSIAWGVWFNTGAVSNLYTKTDVVFVRAVRGGL